MRTLSAAVRTERMPAVELLHVTVQLMLTLAVHDTLSFDSDQDRPFGTLSDIDDTLIFSVLVIVLVPLTGKDVI